MTEARQKTALVIGANRGIGLNLVRELIKRGWLVTGSIRPQSKSDPTVNELEATGANILEIDYLDEFSISTAANEYGKLPLDLLINCGALGPDPRNEEWKYNNDNAMVKTYRVNVIGPFLATVYFFMKLRLSGSGKIINLSSRSASISTNAQGQDISYRMSKTALNQQTVTLAKEFQAEGENVAVVAIYPGYLPTRLSGYKYQNDMEECIPGVVDVIEKVGMEHSGMFLDWKGETMPW